jgi:hypothetical protein
MGVTDGPAFKPRIYHRKGSKKKFSRLLIKCGCCDESVEIEYDDEVLEINGVFATVSAWRSILGPLLKEKSNG